MLKRRRTGVLLFFSVDCSGAADVGEEDNRDCFAKARDEARGEEKKGGACKEVKTGARDLGKVQDDHHQLDSWSGVEYSANNQGGEYVSEGHCR